MLEDDEGIRNSIAIILSEENYEDQSFRDIEEFRKRNRYELADLFLLELMLPDGNGIFVCSSLKTYVHTCLIPVVMMVANYNELQIQKSCEAKGFVAKPFEIASFLHQIPTALHK